MNERDNGSSKYLVHINNNIARNIKYNLSNFEQGALFLAIKKLIEKNLIDVSDKSANSERQNFEVSFTTAEFAKLLNKDLGNTSRFLNNENNFSNIHSIIYSYKDKEGWISGVLVTRMEYKRNLVTINFEASFMSDLVSIYNNFVQLNIQNFQNFKSKYTARLLMLLKSHIHIGKTGSVWYEINKIKELLGVLKVDQKNPKKIISQSYQSVTLFFERCLEPAIKEINDLTNLDVENIYIYDKDDKKQLNLHHPILDANHKQIYDKKGNVKYAGILKKDGKRVTDILFKVKHYKQSKNVMIGNEKRLKASDFLKLYLKGYKGESKIICPFHNDHHPSMQVNQYNLYCFVCAKAYYLVDYVYKNSNLHTIDEANELINQFITKQYNVAVKPKPKQSSLNQAIDIVTADDDLSRDPFFDASDGLEIDLHSISLIPVNDAEKQICFYLNQKIAQCYDYLYTAHQTNINDGSAPIEHKLINEAQKFLNSSVNLASYVADQSNGRKFLFGVAKQRDTKHLINFLTTDILRNQKQKSFLKNLDQAAIKQYLIKLGIIKQADSSDPFDEAYQFFYNRLIFPIYQNNRVHGFVARAIFNNKPKYINSPRSITYQKKDILYLWNANSEKRLFLTEGYKDALSLQAVGINCVALGGIALTDEHILKIKNKYQNVVYLADSDQEGLKTAQTITTKLNEANINVYLNKKELYQCQGVQEMLHAKDPFEWMQNFKNINENKYPLEELMTMIKQHFGNANFYQKN